MPMSRNQAICLRRNRPVAKVGEFLEISIKSQM